MDQQTVKLLNYTGKAQDFPIWSTRFVAMMQTKGLYKSLLGTEEQPNEPAPLAKGAANDEKKNHKVLKDSNEKEVADITLDATTPMLMRHDCVGDMRYESFVIQESFNPATNLTELRKRLQNFHESTAQRHKGQSGSVALAVKRDFKKGPMKGNCFECGIPGHFAKDCRKKETAQCSKCGGKGHLDRACKRQRDGGKHESVAMGPTLATPDEECWAALTQWKTACMLVDSGSTDQIVTNIDAFLDFVPIQSVVRKPNGEASRVVGRGCVRISIPSNKGEF